MSDPKNEIIDEMLETLWTAREKEVSPCALGSHAKVPLSQENVELLTREDYILSDGSMTMTQAGEERAAKIIRRHRLTDVLLYHVLDMKDHETREKVACVTEHNMLPEMMEGICTLLGHPSHSPDGELIPPGACCLREADSVDSVIMRLSLFKRGERGRVAYIKPKSHSRFERLSSFGLLPGTVITLVMDRPAYIISFENTELALDSAAAEDIFVSRLPSQTVPPDKQEKPAELSLLGRITAWIWKEK
ncbi:metal-dependent transcriptional regulator [Myxococcota bacterium]|nr:metal-dependent transcriptional regulator [Myxococcota bacterium]MBU1536819.1 metal-dependent transcriptional regulator [Myxococcota bacterium]